MASAEGAAGGVGGSGDAAAAASPSIFAGKAGGMEGGGILHKQNRHGFRNWKRRWFKVVGQTLVYWREKPREFIVPDAGAGADGGGATSPASLEGGDAGVALPDGYATLDLRGYKAVACQVRKGDTKARFQLKPSGTVPDLPLRDFAAPTQFEADRWIATINNSLCAQNLSRKSRLEARELPTAEDWLQGLGIVDLLPMFREKGYDNMRVIANAGLDDEDLDFLGVSLPIQRRLLKKAAEALGAQAVPIFKSSS